MFVDMQVTWDRKHLLILPGEILSILLRGKKRTEMFVLLLFLSLFLGEAKD